MNSGTPSLGCVEGTGVRSSFTVGSAPLGENCLHMHTAHSSRSGCEYTKQNPA